NKFLLVRVKDSAVPHHPKRQRTHLRRSMTEDLWISAITRLSDCLHIFQPLDPLGDVRGCDRLIVYLRGGALKLIDSFEYSGVNRVLNSGTPISQKFFR